MISFQSFNTYLAKRIGSTTYSFGVRLGCFFRFIPEGTPIKMRDGLPMPEEYHCHLRYTIRKRFPQPECARTDVFYVDPDGKYLPLVVDGVREGLTTEGFEWFLRFSDMREVLRTVQEDFQSVHNGTWGFGANPSPVRYLIRGYVALSLGRADLAINDLIQAASSPALERMHAQIRTDLSRIAHN
ncbi:MAG TPA: hypothetical protein VFA65_07085 [Bryobacteraceae bacterium]|nr:hypothetical protein [Bryobacteraceae bacterium]